MANSSLPYVLELSQVEIDALSALVEAINELFDTLYQQYCQRINKTRLDTLIWDHLWNWIFFDNNVFLFKYSSYIHPCLFLMQREKLMALLLSVQMLIHIIPILYQQLSISLEEDATYEQGRQAAEIIAPLLERAVNVR